MQSQRAFAEEIISATYLVKRTISLAINSAPQSLHVDVIVLPNIEGRQKVLDRDYMIRPEQIIKKGDSQKARFLFTNPTQSFSFTIEEKIQVYRYDLQVALSKRVPSKRIHTQKYLKDAKMIKTNQLDIRLASKHLRAPNKLGTLHNIFGYLEDNMTYEVQKSELGSVFGVRQKKGDCTEYAAIFTTFCRAHNIPARMSYGYLGEGVDPQHAFAEVYLSRHGWIPFEPQRTTRYDYLEPKWIVVSRNYGNGNWPINLRYWGGKVSYDIRSEVILLEEERGSLGLKSVIPEEKNRAVSISKSTTSHSSRPVIISKI